jgi:hypothetical protein
VRRGGIYSRRTPGRRDSQALAKFQRQREQSQGWSQRLLEEMKGLLKELETQNEESERQLRELVGLRQGFEIALRARVEVNGPAGRDGRE